MMTYGIKTGFWLLAEVARKCSWAGKDLSIVARTPDGHEYTIEHVDAASITTGRLILLLQPLSPPSQTLPDEPSGAAPTD